MGVPDILQKQHAMLSNLIQLPHKIVQLQGNEYLPEFVLHELSREHCLNFNKVAYFVDNADFNCVKGVAGIDRMHHYDTNRSIWDNPADYVAYMRSAPFNNRVRAIQTCSSKHQAKTHAQLADAIAHDLGFDNYDLCSWSLKHDNDGFIMYEKGAVDTFADDYIAQALHLLSFCPVG